MKTKKKIRIINTAMVLLFIFLIVDIFIGIYFNLIKDGTKEDIVWSRAGELEIDISSNQRYLVSNNENHLNGQIRNIGDTNLKIVCDWNCFNLKISNSSGVLFKSIDPYTISIFSTRPEPLEKGETIPFECFFHPPSELVSNEVCMVRMTYCVTSDHLTTGIYWNGVVTSNELAIVVI